MLTLNRKSRLALLIGALLSTGLLPVAHAQTPPAPPADTVPPPQTTAPAPGTGASPPAPATEPDKDAHKSGRFRIGPTIGIYLPTDGKTRDRFGSSWFSLGLGLGPVTDETTKGRIGFDFNLLYQSHNDNHVLLIPVGIGYRVALSKDTTAKTVPYAGVTGDVYIINFKSKPDNVNGTYGAGGGSVLLGVAIGDSADLEARYQIVSSVRGLNFSGLNLTAGYRF